jgi:hypothetical protein
MAFADDLLEQAYHLAKRERRNPRQASLRRAVSTAYYAVFHLLIDEAVGNWTIERQRSALARTFDHGKMKKVCEDQVNNYDGSGQPAALLKLKDVGTPLYCCRSNGTRRITTTRSYGPEQMHLQQSTWQARLSAIGARFGSRFSRRITYWRCFFRRLDEARPGLRATLGDQLATEGPPKPFDVPRLHMSVGSKSIFGVGAREIERFSPALDHVIKCRPPTAKAYLADCVAKVKKKNVRHHCDPEVIIQVSVRTQMLRGPSLGKGV